MHPVAVGDGEPGVVAKPGHNAADGLNRRGGGGGMGVARGCDNSEWAEAAAGPAPEPPEGPSPRAMVGRYGVVVSDGHQWECREPLQVLLRFASDGNCLHITLQVRRRVATLAVDAEPVPVIEHKRALITLNGWLVEETCSSPDKRKNIVHP